VIQARGMMIGNPPPEYTRAQIRRWYAQNQRCENGHHEFGEPFMARRPKKLVRMCGHCLGVVFDSELTGDKDA
jgi:hypothetical protein